MPLGMEDVHVLRIVVRNGFSLDIAELLIRDLRFVVEALEQREERGADLQTPTAFHH
jgi:glutamate decarboxylase